MNYSTFNNFLTYQSLSTGNTLAYYDFSSYSGEVLFNQVHGSGKTLAKGCIDSRYYPAFVSCVSTGDFFSSSGSGYFNGDASLKIGDTIDLNEFTIFVNFSYQNHSTGKPNVVLSTIGSGFTGSGFYVYVNDANRACLEYSKNNLPFSVTLDSELDPQNIISIGKTATNSVMDLAHHDILDRTNDVVSFKPTSYSKSNLLTFGGTNFSNSSTTGISGHIDHIAIYSKYIPISKRNEIAKSFVATGISRSSFSFSSENINVISSVTYQNQVTGTGITGYQSIGSKNISLRCGSPVSICDLSGITGELSGNVLSAITSADQISVSNRSISVTNIDYDYEYLKKFASNYLFVDKDYSFDSNDIYEIYSFNRRNDNLNVLPIYLAGRDVYRLDLDYANQDVNFYYNGLAQFSGGRNGSNVNNDYSLVGTDIDSDSFYDFDDAVIYDKISGDSNSGLFTGQNIFEISGFDFSGTHDVFFNGQKLISGLEYYHVPIWGQDAIVATGFSGHGSGIVFVLPRASGLTRYTGSTSYELNFANKLISPQFWINGARQRRGQDFEVIRSDSLLRSENEFDIFTSNIYNNNSKYFNI
jgi:hypothetical protein